MRSLCILSATTSLPLQCTARPGSIVHHRARKCYNASECAQLLMAAVNRARSTHATVEAAGRHACQLHRAGDFFFFFGSADPRIFEYSNGSSADPDRSRFRWIRFTPNDFLQENDGERSERVLSWNDFQMAYKVRTVTVLVHTLGPPPPPQPPHPRKGLTLIPE